MLKKAKETRRGCRIVALALAILMVFSFTVPLTGAGAVTVSAAGKFVYTGKNISKYKGTKTFVFDQNVSSKNQKDIEKAYKKQSSNFEKVTRVEFSDKVTKVTSAIFTYFPNVKTIVLGKKVSEVPESDGFVNENNPILTKLTTFVVSSKNSNYSARDGVLYNKSKSKLVKIPEAFKKSSYSMPESVTKVAGDNSVYNCSKIQNFAISKGFEGNLRKLNTLPKLSTITVAQGNTDYVAEDGVLYDVAQTKLVCWPSAKKSQTITLPDTLKSLNVDQLPTSVVTLTIPKNMESIYSNNTDFTYYPKRYPLNALENLSTIAVAEGNTNFVVEGGGLYNAKKTVCYGIPMKTAVTEVAIAEGVEGIYSQLLAGHKTITKLTLSSTVKGANNYYTDIFGGNDGLESLTEYVVSEKNPVLKAVDGVLYSLDGKNLYCYPIAKAGSAFVIPDEVENIYNNAFSDKCKNLTKLTFGKSVKALGTNGITLPNLVEYVVSDENTSFCARDGVLYNKYMTAICGYPKKKPDKTFEIGDDVEYMAYYGTFANDYLKELDIQGDVEIPNDSLSESLPKLESITAGSNSGFKAQNGVLYSSRMDAIYCYPPCKDNAEFIVPDSVTTIYSDALVNNSYLKKITLGKKTRFINPVTFAMGCKKLTKIEVNKKNKYFTSKDGVLYDKKMTILKSYPAGSKKSSYTLPKTVKSIAIDSTCFQANKSLKKLKVEKGNKYFTSDGKTITNKKGTETYSLIKEKSSEK
ncbi:MAG: leucine-rich repeat protein [Lachnospiraceae bacterium]|nr:leucine-rich repeat protein [Lachnospiraceae bacterium]